MAYWKRAAGDAVWNLVGQVVPGLVALIAVPRLLAGLGSDRFGVIGLAWATVGYFGMLDFGIGRAVTKVAAETLAAGDERRLRIATWTGWLTLLAIGTVTGLLGAAASGTIAGRLLHVPPSLVGETASAFRAIAFAVPAVVLTAGARGVLEAHSDFRLVSLVRVPVGILAFAAPLFLLGVTHNVGAHVAAIALSRALGAIALVVAALWRVPVLRRPTWGSREELVALFRFGSWITVSNVISPLMATVDRFVIGGMLSLAAVAHYVTPFELSSRLLILPAALATVVFPRFAAEGTSVSPESARLFRGAATVLVLSMLPAIVVGVLMAPELLRGWAGIDAVAGAGALRWLLPGMLLNALAHLPFAHLQARGRANVTARVHLIELPLYAAALPLLVNAFGVTGVAIAWAGRAALDFALLNRAAFANGAPGIATLAAGVSALMLAALALAQLPSLVARLAVASVIGVAGVCAWVWIGGHARVRALIVGRERGL